MVQLEKSILDKLLRGYDPNVRPNLLGTADSPTKIKVNMFITDIFDVNDIKMEYTLQLYLKQTWIDPRLMYPDPEGIMKSIPVTIHQRIWTPDIFFNEREGKFHNIQRSNRFIKIYPYGMVFFSSRLTLKLRCAMDFKFFPFDRQLCSFDVESYGFSPKDIELAWAEGNPVQINTDVQMSNFVLEDFEVDYCDEAVGESHGCLRVLMLFKRKYGFYLTQVFIPLLILVAVSWMSFWLDTRAMTLRLTLLAILTFITLTLISSVNVHFPAVSYTKAIDLWEAVCMSFIFGAFLQFILVNQLARRERKVRMNGSHATENGGTSYIRNNLKESSSVNRIWNRHGSQRIPVSKRIDFACRMLFPAAFVAFNCIFWLTHIRGRDNLLLRR